MADVQHYQLGGETHLQSYEPFAQAPFDFMTLVVRVANTAGGAPSDALAKSSLPAAIRIAIYSVDKDQPIASIRPLTTLVADSVARPRFAMFLFAVFAGVALLLSAIGIYGVISYSVTQRTGEIGIRIALGAQRSDVLQLVFVRAAKLVAFGLASGVIGALLLTRLISSMLFGVSPQDPLTFATIIALLAAISAIACWLPARRATKVDPMVALRAE